MGVPDSRGKTARTVIEAAFSTLTAFRRMVEVFNYIRCERGDDGRYKGTGTYDNDFVVLQLPFLSAGEEGDEREEKCYHGGDESQD